MSKPLNTLLAVIFCSTVASHSAGAADGFTSMFDGKSLDGWEGVPELWSVKDGAITGQTTKEVPAKENTFLVWKGGDVADFEMTCKYRIIPGDEKGFGNARGSNIAAGSSSHRTLSPPGYQADMEAGKTYSGILYEEKARGILAKRGQKVVLKQSADPKKPTIEVVGSTGNSEEIQATIKPGEWNDYRIVVKGNHLQHFINGHQTIDVTDETAEGAKSGILALQLHAGPPMKVQFKELMIKKL